MSGPITNTWASSTRYYNCCDSARADRIPPGIRGKVSTDISGMESSIAPVQAAKFVDWLSKYSVRSARLRRATAMSRWATAWSSFRAATGQDRTVSALWNTNWSNGNGSTKLRRSELARDTLETAPWLGASNIAVGRMVQTGCLA